MDKSHFQMMAGYGAWANSRLIAACGALPDSDYYQERGAFFGSIHKTLNHILVGDRVWFGRISGIDSGITALDEILFEDRDALFAGREMEDARISSIIEGMDEETIAGPLRYTPIVNPEPIETPMRQVLTHVFNHATHHRGQVHCLLSQVPCTPPPLDLIFYLREN